MKLSVVRFDPLMVFTFKAYTAAIDLGEMLMWTTSGSYVTPATATTSDATFVGISGGQARLTVDSGNEITVYQRCICRCALTSAAYIFGAGLKWASASSLVADGNADTIGWFVDSARSGQTLTEGLVLFDVAMLGAIKGLQYDVASA